MGGPGFLGWLRFSFLGFFLRAVEEALRGEAVLLEEAGAEAAAGEGKGAPPWTSSV